METLETEGVGEPGEAIISPTPWGALWRPWYMTPWWALTIAWNVAPFYVDGTDAVPGAWIFTFLLFPFAPLVPFIYQVLSSWREQFLFPWDPGFDEAIERGEANEAGHLLFDEEEIAAERFRALTDPTDFRSGVLFFGNPLNPLNRHD